MEMVEVKVRQVGNALGVILPGALVKSEKLKKGDSIKLSVLRERKIDARSLLGLTRGASPFVREHDHRD